MSKQKLRKSSTTQISFNASPLHSLVLFISLFFLILPGIADGKESHSNDFSRGIDTADVRVSFGTPTGGTYLDGLYDIESVMGVHVEGSYRFHERLTSVFGFGLILASWETSGTVSLIGGDYTGKPSVALTLVEIPVGLRLDVLQQEDLRAFIEIGLQAQTPIQAEYKGLSKEDLGASTGLNVSTYFAVGGTYYFGKNNGLGLKLNLSMLNLTGKILEYQNHYYIESTASVFQVGYSYRF